MALFFNQNNTRNKLDKIYNMARNNWCPFDKCWKLVSTDAYCIIASKYVQFTRISEKKLPLNMPTILTIDTIQKDI